MKQALLKYVRRHVLWNGKAKDKGEEMKMERKLHLTQSRELRAWIYTVRDKSIL